MGWRQVRGGLEAGSRWAGDRLEVGWRRVRGGLEAG